MKIGFSDDFLMENDFLAFFQWKTEKKSTLGAKISENAVLTQKLVKNRLKMQFFRFSSGKLSFRTENSGFSQFFQFFSTDFR